VQVPSFDPMKLVQKLAIRLRPRGSDGSHGGGVLWKQLGLSCGVCFNAVPDRVSFLAGPLDAELPDKKARRQQAERKRREPATKVAEVELKQVKDQDGEDDDEDDDEEGDGDDKKGGKADRLSACETNRKKMKVLLHKKYHSHKSDSADPTRVDAIKFLLNPKSFTQSVENLFNFSFLVKKGEAEIGVSDSPGLGQTTRGLYVTPRNNGDNMACRQAVIGFTLRDWKRLCDAAGLEEGDLPHRATKIAKRGSDDAVGQAEAADDE
jgi:non-structural maintenance of chromosomes element 4